MTLLVGTNRPGSNSRKIGKQVEEIYAAMKIPLTVIDLTELPADIFASSSYGAKPASFARFSDDILNSTGLIVITPEYNGSFPGILKYFIDMLKFPESFEKRPVCFIGVAAGIWGALRSVEQLQQIFGYRNAFLYPERVFIPRVNSVMDDSGKLTDATITERLTAQATGFVDFVEKQRQVSLRKH